MSSVEEQKVELTWSEGLRFEGRTESGAVTTIDGEGGLSPSPVSLLLESVGACAAVDVVMILEKGREPLEGLVVEVSGTRRAEAPRRFTSLRFRFRVEGDVDEAKAERAVALSLETYCSVFHTLRGDLEVAAEVEVVS